MIKFKTQNIYLLLEYEPLPGNDWIYEQFDNDESISIKGTFIFSRENLQTTYPTDLLEYDREAPVNFVLGVMEGNYYKIDKNILSTNYSVFIHREIRLSPKFFTAERKVSILKKIDNLVNEEIYIGGDAPNALPESEYLKIIKGLPNNYELHKYVDARISSVLRDYFDTATDGERAYNAYMNKKVSHKGKNLINIFSEYELHKFEEIQNKLETMLQNEIQYNEKQWQDEILQIILLIYPKYLQVFKEAPVKDSTNSTFRSLDYLLVDSCGNIDIIEIKRPFNKSIVSKSQYRDNYIPLRELSGTIMQIEKYIFNLNRWGKTGEEYLTKKYEDQLPDDFKIKITNPNGIIIMGREDKLCSAQMQDFEVIKRKYKNIVDIITYDDLLRRLNFTIEQMKDSTR